MTRCEGLLFLAAVLLYPMLVAPAGGTEVWTPETGEVDLERRPRQEPEARFRHAAALLAAGQNDGAVRLLRELLQKHPDAEWAEEAHFMLGLALHNDGRYKAAYRAWETLREKYPDSKRTKRVFTLQRQAAIQRTEKSVKKGMKMFDRLSKAAPDREAGVLTRKARADALLQAGEYLRASDQYLALIDYYPNSKWVPYAWYQMGVCHLKLAKWIGRGTEHLEEAERRLEDFIRNFPENEYTDEAKATLEEVRSLRVEKHRRVAQYYMGPGDRPTAALPYLRYMQDALPDSEQAQWAREKIQQILNEREAPTRGQSLPMSLPGVTADTSTEGPTQ
jgi:outer membrane assembly lipoprotein YfiO